MEFGLFTCPYQYDPLEKAFRDAADFGYDFIELWGGRPHAYPYDLQEDISEIRELIEKYSMPVKVYTPEINAYPYNFMLASDRQWEKCMDYVDISLNAACRMGAEAALFAIGHGGNVPEDRRRDRLMKSLRRMAELADKNGVMIMVETLTPFESNTCTGVRELYDVLKAADSDMLCPMVDLAAPFTQGEDPADYVRMFGKRLNHMHLVDSDGESDTHLIPGEGIMDLKNILTEMRSLGFDGTATIELVTHYMSDPSYYAELALKKAKELLE
ncbi:MAG: TIM barrel protein [Parasporobacterium sp.]|nr:TIM barrel protein [Parasporobacterium sp.]